MSIPLLPLAIPWSTTPTIRLQQTSDKRKRDDLNHYKPMRTCD
jgi:hypothetical protein